jgi:hypothetical protein
MAAALTKKTTAMMFKRPDQINPLHAASSGRQPKPFTNDLCPAEFLFCEQTIGFEYQAHGFAEILASFIQCLALGVGAGKFLDKGDIPAFGSFMEDCCEFEWHGSSVFRIYQAACLDA